MDLIQDEFYTDIKKMFDMTQCARADREIEYEDGVPVLPKIKCEKEKEICGICPFWKSAVQEIEKIAETDKIDEKIKNIFDKAGNNAKEYRGRNCRILGDIIICLEALKGMQTPAVCSSNKKDFQPVCDTVGIELVVPDFSWKKNT